MASRINSITRNIDPSGFREPTSDIDVTFFRVPDGLGFDLKEVEAKIDKIILEASVVQCDYCKCDNAYGIENCAECGGPIK